MKRLLFLCLFFAVSVNAAQRIFPAKRLACFVAQRLSHARVVYTVCGDKQIEMYEIDSLLYGKKDLQTGEVKCLMYCRTLESAPGYCDGDVELRFIEDPEAAERAFVALQERYAQQQQQSDDTRYNELA